jgi:hypothetical protein
MRHRAEHDQTDERFFQKHENHRHSMALHFLHYNCVQVHKTLKMFAAGVTKRLWEMKDVIDMLEEWEATRAHGQSN